MGDQDKTVSKVVAAMTLFMEAMGMTRFMVD
jgi:hypothetical protein